MLTHMYYDKLGHTSKYNSEVTNLKKIILAETRIKSYGKEHLIKKISHLPQSDSIKLIN